MTRIAVIGGGRSSEHQVSLASAAGVVGALSDRHDVLPLTIDRAGGWQQADGCTLTPAQVVQLLSGCDVAVPMLHGTHGEDGTAAAFCDLIGIPVVGCDIRAAAVAMDKWSTKLVAEAVGIRTAAALLITGDRARRIAAGDPELGWSGPVVVKPASAGSSDGANLVHEAVDLPAAVAAALIHDDRVLIERVVAGREVDVGVLGRPDGSRVVAPMLEIVTGGIFDNTAKYDGSADFRIPADLPDAARLRLQQAAIAMYDALGCAGVVRVDFFWTADGPVLNEVNTIPGFTEQSQVPKMFAAGGTDYADLLELLITDVLVDIDATPAAAAS